MTFGGGLDSICWGVSLGAVLPQLLRGPCGMLLPEPACPETTHIPTACTMCWGGGVCLGSSAPRVLLCTSTHTLVLEGGAPSPVVPQG